MSPTLFLWLVFCAAPEAPVRATVHKVYDGDTITVTIHLPFGVDLPQKTVRAYGYDAWEIKKGRRTVRITPEERAAGKKAQQALSQLLKTEVWLEDSGKHDPYGRISARLWVKNGENWIDVAAWAVENGHTRQ